MNYKTLSITDSGDTTGELTELQMFLLTIGCVWNAGQTRPIKISLSVDSKRKHGIYIDVIGKDRCSLIFNYIDSPFSLYSNGGYVYDIQHHKREILYTLSRKGLVIPNDTYINCNDAQINMLRHIINAHEHELYTESINTVKTIIDTNKYTWKQRYILNILIDKYHTQ